MTRKDDDDRISGLLQEVFSDREEMRRFLAELINEAMQAEVTEHLKAGWHEHSAERQGYRNGSKPRRLATRVGKVELQVPQTRGCEPYHPSLFGRWERSERALLVACAEMYSQGVSTRKVQDVLEQMCGMEVSAATVSRVAAELDEKLAAFRTTRLDGTPYRYLVIDARYERVRGVFAGEGRAECLRRGEEMALKWQARCPAVAKMLREGLEDCLTVLDFPQHHRRRLHSTNLLESLMKRLKARTKVVGVFPNRASCDRLAGAILIEVDEEWSLETAPYFGMEHAGDDAVRAIT